MLANREASTNSIRAGSRMSRRCAHPISAQKSTKPKAIRETPSSAAMVRALAKPLGSFDQGDD